MTLHHVELWVPDLAGALHPWGWLFTSLGWQQFQDWEHGRSWRDGQVYVVLEQSPALSSGTHDRRAPGLNHLAFTVAGRAEVDRLTAEAPAHGWSLMFADRHPHAGGPEHYAAYLEDDWGYEVELVAA
ncbi:VOC family protein [Symbioplanes lichenis]|uniref:VOC family protein n=1 Tax=Symbioplanes lichenis TaxID=1629072 RepID=UPI002738FB85|nr:VOC family protein [Actinoplanes lichenis]